MIDSIGVKKQPSFEEEKKLREARQIQTKKEEAPAVPQGVEEMNKAVAASANAPDAVSYQAISAQNAVPGTAADAPTQENIMQNNVAAVEEADKIMGHQAAKGAKTEEKGKDEPKAQKDEPSSIVAPQEEKKPGDIPKPEEKVGAVKEESPSAPAQTAAPAPPPKVPPAEQTKEEQKIKDPGKAEANIASDSEELLKRKLRKGEQPQ